MIRSLRIRFIRTAVLAVALVLLLILGAINLLNYRNVARDADAILTILQDGDRFVIHCLRPEYAEGLDDSSFIHLLRRFRI